MNKRYLPSIGFVLLILSFAFIGGVVYISLGPTKGEYESLGHKYYAENKFEKAADMFIAAGKNTREPAGKSRCFRSAASAYHALRKYNLSLEYLFYSLQYNKNNRNAYSILRNIAVSGIDKDYKILIYTLNKVYRLEGTDKKEVFDIVQQTVMKIPALELENLASDIDPQLLQELFAKESVMYISRYRDGWSMGKHAGVLILSEKNKVHIDYVLELKTAFPSTFYPVTVTLKSNAKLQDININQGDVKEIDLALEPGVNFVWLTLDKSFTPSQVGPSKDTRNLGVRYKVNKK